MPGQDTFEREIIPRLLGVRRRLRLYALAEGLAIVFVVCLVLGLAQLGLDYSFRLPIDMRAALLGVVLAGLGWVVFRQVVQPARVRVGLGDVARLIERKNPQLDDELISALEFFGQAERAWQSGVLMRSVIERAARGLETVSFDSILNHRRVRQRGMVITAVVFSAAVMAVAKPGLVGLWFERNVLLHNVDWPQRTYLRVLNLTDGRLRQLRGEDLNIAVKAEGVVPASVVVDYEQDDGATGRDRMIGSGSDRFVLTMRNVNQPLRFRVRGGDDESDWVPVELVDAPQVASLAMRVTPPAYTKLAAYDLRQGQPAVEVLKGSAIGVTIQVNKPLKRVALMRGRSLVQPCRRGDAENTWHATFRPDETAGYQFELEDMDGFHANRPTRFSVRVSKDTPPKVRLHFEGVGEMVVPGAVLPVEVKAEDSYGMADLALAYEVGGQQTLADQIRFDDFRPESKRFEKKFDWALADLNLEPGQRLIAWGQARDFDDVSGPNLGESAKYSLRLVTPEELQAEMSRREQEYQHEFERLLNQQEELRLDLLSALDRSGNARSERAGALERRQRHLATRSRAIADQFARVLGELEINQLATPELRERLDDGIAAPLERLAREEMQVAAAAMAKLGGGDVPDRTGLDGRQQAILEQMRSILANMVKWEGYQEVVGLLRNIVKLQNDVATETRESASEAAEDFFGTESPPDSSNP